MPQQNLQDSLMRPEVAVKLSPTSRIMNSYDALFYNVPSGDVVADKALRKGLQHSFRENGVMLEGTLIVDESNRQLIDSVAQQGVIEGVETLHNETQPVPFEDALKQEVIDEFRDYHDVKRGRDTGSYRRILQDGFENRHDGEPVDYHAQMDDMRYNDPYYNQAYQDELLMDAIDRDYNPSREDLLHDNSLDGLGLDDETSASYDEAVQDMVQPQDSSWSDSLDGSTNGSSNKTNEKDTELEDLFTAEHLFEEMSNEDIDELEQNIKDTKLHAMNPKASSHELSYSERMLAAMDSYLNQEPSFDQSANEALRQGIHDTFREKEIHVETDTPFPKEFATYNYHLMLESATNGVSRLHELEKGSGQTKATDLDVVSEQLLLEDMVATYDSYILEDRDAKMKDAFTKKFELNYPFDTPDHQSRNFPAKIHLTKQGVLDENREPFSQTELATMIENDTHDRTDALNQALFKKPEPAQEAVQQEGVATTMGHTTMEHTTKTHTAQNQPRTRDEELRTQHDNLSFQEFLDQSSIDPVEARDLMQEPLDTESRMADINQQLEKLERSSEKKQEGREGNGSKRTAFNYGQAVEPTKTAKKEKEVEAPKTPEQTKQPEVAVEEEEDYGLDF